MALLFMDGFGHTNQKDLHKYDGPDLSTDIYYGNGYGRDGGWGMNIGNNAAILKSTNKDATTIIVGIAFYISSISGNEGYPTITIGADMPNNPFLDNLRFVLVPDGAMVVYIGASTVLGQTAVSLFQINTWTYLEVKVFIDDTTGTVDIQKDNVNILSLTDQDTDFGSYGYINCVKIAQYNTSFCYVDDLYICDASGSYNNDFLGDVTIATLYPKSDGTYTDFVLSEGTDHFAVVDDPQLADLSTYSKSSNSGDKESFNMDIFPGSDVIFGLQTSIVNISQTTGIMQVKDICRSNGINYTKHTTEVSQSYKHLLPIYEKDPASNNDWTEAMINNAEFGIEVV